MEWQLDHDAGATGVAAAAALLGVKANVKPGESRLVHGGKTTVGDEAVLRVLAHSHPASRVVGTGHHAAAVEQAASKKMTSEELERHLTLRTFVAGHTLSLADLAHLAAAGSGPHSKRWKALVEHQCGVKAAAGEAGDDLNMGAQGSFEKMQLDDAVEGKARERENVLRVVLLTSVDQGGGEVSAGAVGVSAHGPRQGGAAQRLLSDAIQGAADSAL